jgi:hypothetical protein
MSNGADFWEKSFAAAKRKFGPKFEPPGSEVITVDEAQFVGKSFKPGQKKGVTFSDLSDDQKKKLEEKRKELFPE